MDSLIQDLQKTIEALETLSLTAANEDGKIDELLDQLFQQKIDLVNASLNVSSPPFQQASQAVKQAAAKAEKAVKDAARVGETMGAVAEAIAKLAKLLDNLAPIA